MISKPELQEQKLKQMIIDLIEMGDDLVAAIENANYKKVKQWKMPTEHMKMACSKWKTWKEE